jgi:hypothetical protein
LNRLPSDKTFPSVDESADRLHRAGCSIGEIVSGSGWRVFGTNGENMIDVTAKTQAETWWRACEAARSLGLLGAPVSTSRVRQFFD